MMYHTINLNVNKSWNNQKPTTVNDNIGSNSLIKKHFLWVENFAISNPQIITYYLVIS